MHRHILLRSLVILGCFVLAASAQTETDTDASAGDQAGQTGTVAGRRGKFEIYSATSSIGYSSFGSLGSSSVGLGSLLADYDVTSSVSAGYISVDDKGYISLVYTPSYTQRVRFSKLSAFEQSLTLSMHRPVSRRGRLRISLNIADMTAQQLAFLPSTFANAASTNATSGDLVKAIMGQPQTNIQLDQVFTLKDSGNAAILATLFGARMLSGAAHLEYDWAASARSELFASMDGVRDQPLAAPEFGQQIQYTLRSSAAAAAFGWNYNLTPKTTIGLGVDYDRSRSGYFNGDVIDTKYTVGREFRRIWFATVGAGLGRLSIMPETPGAPVRQSMTWLGSGTFGVKGRGQALIFHVNRTAGDSYGLGSDSNTTTGASWSWNPHRRTWSLLVDGSYQDLQTAGKSGMTATTAGGGLEKKINRQTTASFSLVYLNSSGQTLISGEPRLTGYQARFTLMWRPRPVI